MKLKTAEYIMQTSVLGGILLTLIIDTLWFKILLSVVMVASFINYRIVYNRQSDK